MLYVCSAGNRPHCLHLPGDAPLPCMQQLRLTASMFFRHAGTNVGWTDLRALTALERFYRSASIPFRVDRVFCGREPLTSHGSGIAFDLGRDLSSEQRRLLRYRAIASGLFSSVLSEALCPDCVHVECLRRDDLRLGDFGVFVFPLQRALEREHCFHGVCSGMFCAETERAVRRVQIAVGQPPTGIADARLLDMLRKRRKYEFCEEG